MSQGEQKDSVSDTPRTDARLIEGIMLDGRVEQLDRVYATFARKLERELNEANAIIRQQQLLDEENLRLQDRIHRLESALREIANQDYRGSRSTESQIAFRALQP